MAAGNLNEKPMGERVASLETQTITHHEWLTKVAGSLESLDQKVGDILTTIAGNKGFFNGVVFTLAALGGILGFILAKAWEYMVNGGHHPV